MSYRHCTLYKHCTSVGVHTVYLCALQMQKLSLQLNRLHWLDFSDRLLAANGKDLNPSLNFDGTHMSPRYVSYMNGALESIS